MNTTKVLAETRTVSEQSSLRTKDAFLSGVTPLLYHNDDVEWADILGEWRNHPDNKSASVRGDDRSPAWTWQGYLYHDGEHVVLPASNVMAALCKAGAQVSLGGGKRGSFKSLTQSGLFFSSEFLDFEGSKGQIAIADVCAMRGLSFKQQADGARDLGFRLDLRRASVGASKHVRVRPRFDVWSASGELNIVAPEITEDILGMLASLAGRAGVGDWRPSAPKKPGSYGQFTARIK